MGVAHQGHEMLPLVLLTRRYADVTVPARQQGQQGLVDRLIPPDTWGHLAQGKPGQGGLRQ